MGLNDFADLTEMQFAMIYTAMFKSDQKIKGYAQKIVQKPNKKLNNQQLNYVSKYVQRQIQSKKDILRNNQNNQLIHQILNNQNQISERIKSIKNYINKHQNLNKQFLQQIYQNPVEINSKIKSKKLDSSLSNNGLLSLTYTITNLTANQFQKIQNKNQPLKLVENQNLNDIINSQKQYIDWTLNVGRPRTQGICGACYTFATNDAVSALYSIYKFGFFVPLSTQQIIDCAYTNGLTYGCGGGFLQGSLGWILQYGIQPQALYPYISKQSSVASQCKIQTGPLKISSFENIPQGDCPSIIKQLKYGPLSVGLAGYRLQFYSQGIFNDCNSFIDHAVVLIGYKTEIGWKIKNSWGSRWGMNGFGWISEKNNCGLCNMAVKINI